MFCFLYYFPAIVTISQIKFLIDLQYIVDPLLSYEFQCGLFYLPGCFPHLYNLVEYGKNWAGAQEYCRNKYTDLATVHNEQDLAKLRNLTKGLHNVWIGLIPDTETEFRMWNDGEPNDLGHHKVCAAMLENGKWADVECNNQLPFFCYNKSN
uniref:C-type lectin domain-containing protein n=1 Tax=Neolamprologus brichardi TaxID=32507 RepID=A0A3Q4GNT6_NEOBR